MNRSNGSNGRLIMRVCCRCFHSCALGLLLSVGHESLAAVRHVNVAQTTGANDGTSWENAYQGPAGLATAITAAVSSDQIWVAAGTYRPTLTTNRALYFNLKNGVGIYGGFAGDEAALAQRDFVANVTILSGDLLGNDPNNADNSFHVVNGASANSSAILDGFTITAGNANTAVSDQDKGGGMIFLTNSNATIRNCIISFNRCT